jgi:alanyl-tRNA synthetase
MNSTEIYRRYTDFFIRRGHKLIPSASLIPENDPTVLFTTAGMHPLTPYLMGVPHPSGVRLVDIQKCLRTVDIDEVGDASHLTFFEMLGNWSLGDYFKKEAIQWSFELLTDADDGFGLDPKRLYISIFEGDEDAPRDEESAGHWKTAFATAGIKAEEGSVSEGVKPNKRIFPYPKDKNWWGPAGQTGPCGPDSEMFYDTLNLGEVSKHAPGHEGKGPCHPNCDCGRFVEIWNDVFMEFNKKEDGSYELLKKKNVDTGMGFDRMCMLLQEKETVYETDLFEPILNKIGELSTSRSPESERIVADHIRAATFLISDGVSPSNVEQGYILRRLIRRAIRHARLLGITKAFCSAVSEVVVERYSERYPELAENRELIHDALAAEELKFQRTVDRGLRKLESKIYTRNIDSDEAKKRVPLSGKEVFELYETHGFPPELTFEIAEVNEYPIKEDWQQEFNQAQSEHQELSRVGAEQKFAGGLADHSVETTRLHTATHLMLESLRRLLGDHVQQKGANITKERLRFDFTHPEKLTPEQITQLEEMVNAEIKADLHVHFEEMTLDEAKKKGATGVFEHKYGDRVKVYFMGAQNSGDYFSKEICGGPHVTHTGELGHFKVIKEESSSAGVRRIRAVLE